MASVSEPVAQNYFCPVQQVRLTWRLCLSWFYFDPLSTFALLTVLFRLICCQTTINSGRLHNHYYRSTSSLDPAAWLDIFPLLVSLRSAWPLSCAWQLLDMDPCNIRWKEYGTCSAPHSQFSTLLRLHCVLRPARTMSASLLPPICDPRLYFASSATCLLCFLVVSFCHTECSRNKTHSSPQP